MPRDLAHANDMTKLNTRFADDPRGAIAYVASGAIGPTALVSSFGAESVVLLHMIARVDRHLPVIFIDTLLLFPETLAYQNKVAAHLGLTDLRRVTPDRVDLFLHDPDVALHGADPDACCALRKAQPLARALTPFSSWISGRKRFQNGERANLDIFERDLVTDKIKINPLAGFTQDNLRTYIAQHDLPHHPLVERGFLSVGCVPCTSAVQPGETARAGRWRGQAKTECGIHVVGGTMVQRKEA